MKLLSLEKGSYGHQAARSLDGNAQISFCDSNLHILQRAVLGEGIGIVPIENSTEGLVSEVLKGFWLKEKNSDARTAYVIGEIQIPINHCLLVNAGAKETSALSVSSHPQALGQCQNTLSRMGIKIKVPSISTARAAKELSESKDLTRAAIAPKIAAETFGLEIRAENIQDSPNNATRFHLVGTVPQGPTGKDKTAILYRLPHRPASLRDSIDLIANLGLNLYSMHSISLGSPRKYAFYIEFEGHQDEVLGRKIVDAIRKVSEGRMHILGSYPKSVE